MRLCTFEVRTPLGRIARLGAETPHGIVDLHFAAAAHLGSRPLAQALVPPAMKELLQGGDRSLDAARAALAWLPQDLHTGSNDETIVYAAGAVQLLAPLPEPASVRDFYAFEDHVKRGFERRGEPMPPEWYEIPVYYQTGHHYIVGTGADIPWPSFTQQFDYELELAAVIGKPGRDLKAANALDHIVGFTVMNDCSARDIQRREMKVRLGPAKGKHWCTALGPVLVTRDELGDPYSLTMTASINGEEWSRGHSGSIHWRFEQMLEFLTEGDSVVPGDVIGSGTVGTGCGLELDRWVRRGDEMALTIDRIGTLRNRVV